MSVRLTRERSWVRAPLFPRIRLGSENTGTEPFFVGFKGNNGKKAFRGVSASKGLEWDVATSGRRRNGDVFVNVGVVVMSESRVKNKVKFD